LCALLGKPAKGGFSVNLTSWNYGNTVDLLLNSLIIKQFWELILKLTRLVAPEGANLMNALYSGYAQLFQRYPASQFSKKEP
jgi:hypothetical protein